MKKDASVGSEGDDEEEAEEEEEAFGAEETKGGIAGLAGG